MFTFFEVSLQVHGEQRRAGGVVGTSHGPVVTAGLMFSANRDVGVMKAENVS